MLAKLTRRVWRTISAGYIKLLSPVSLNSNLTSAGRGAPDGGIDIMAAEGSLSGKKNRIMRNVLRRQGTLDTDTGKSALNMQGLTGLPNDGHGTIASGTPFLSTSGDAIPDYSANANGISTSDPAAGAAPYGTTGYLNLKAYFNSLILSAPWSASGLPGTPMQGASTYNLFIDQWLLTGSDWNASCSLSEGQFPS